MGVEHLYKGWSTDPIDYPFFVDPDAENFVQNLASPGPSPVPFAALTYITACGLESDHPYARTTRPDGPEWLAWVINAIGQSKYWDSTAIVVVWDDWGGWYDHEPSPGPFRPAENAYGLTFGDPNEWGYRVPLFVISPYITAPGYVSTGNSTYPWRSQSVILQLAEGLFKTASLGTDDMQDGNTSDGLHDMLAPPPSATPLPFATIPEPTGWSPPSVLNSCEDGWSGGPASPHRKHHLGPHDRIAQRAGAVSRADRILPSPLPP